MKNLNDIKQRYLREPFDRQLGHLASNLLRISNFLDNSQNIKIVDSILEESKFFIEWAAPQAPFHIQALLSEMQPKLALWQRDLAKQKNLQDLREFAKNWSMQLAEASGLLV